MLFYCRYEWHSGTTREQVAQRFQQLDQAGLHHQDRWRGWYQLGGGGAGFLLVETDDPRQLTEMFQPYMDLMSWDVHPVYEHQYEEMRQSLRQAAPATR